MSLSTFQAPQSLFGGRSHLLPDAALALMMVSLSASQAKRWLPIQTVWIILPFAGLAMLALCRGLSVWMRRRPAPSGFSVSTTIGIGLLAIFLLGAFVVLFPLSKSGRYGPGSDRDHALALACADLRAGQFPYGRLTYLGNPTTAMPGELFLAMPFFLTGSVVAQNLFWMAVFVMVLAHAAGKVRNGLAACWLLLLGSPEVLREFVTGGDLGTTAFMVLSGVYVLLKLLPVRRWSWLGAALLLGMALSSRPIYLMLLPVFGSRMLAVTSPRRAVCALAVVVGLFGLVTLPFYLANPAGFTPLTVGGKLGVLRTYLPYADVLIYLVTAAAALIGAAVWAWRSQTAFYWTCGTVTALPIFLGELTMTVAEHGLYFVYLPYLHVAIYFCVVAWVRGLSEANLSMVKATGQGQLKR